MRGIGCALICAITVGRGQSWTPPRTPDGQPDLQGIWTNATLTPLERPSEFTGKAFLTNAEAAEFEKRAVQSNDTDRRDANPDVDVNQGYNNFWWGRGTKVVASKRTSLIVDPSDGKVPALTPEARKRLDDGRAWAGQHPADGPEDRTLGERCILFGPVAGPPMLPGPYNNNYQIIQTPAYVVILVEMIHDARIIPLDGRPHLPRGVQQWRGDSRGRWEGNTLVVDTTNFTGKTKFRGSGENLHVVERFTRTSPDTILYQFTVDDPSSFTKAWTAEIPLSKTTGPIFEYACHEGNYGMVNILSGARADERQAAAAKTGKP